MKRLALAALAAVLAVPTFGPDRAVACDAACQFETVAHDIAARDGVTVDVAAQRLGDLLAPDPVAYVNSLPYSYLVMEPAVEAWQVVAAARGWQPGDIAVWTPFIRAVMVREGKGCWNLLGGATFANGGAGCAIGRQGRRTDSGFGQVLMSVHAGWLCRQEGLCDKWAVISSPWSSMTALVALLERNPTGRDWCYTAKLRAGAVCRSRP